MRILLRRVAPCALALVTTGALAVPPAHGQAQAGPPGRLHGTGALRAASCPEPPLISGGIPRSKEYLTAIVRCMDTGWSAHFRRAGLRYRAPRVLYFEQPQDEVCGLPWPGGAAAFYCTRRATLVFPLEGPWIEGRTDLYPLKIAAHEYGHHVQQQAGVRSAYERLVRARRGDQAELGRRYELQADCLAGVFTASVWRSLGRSPADWTALVEAVRASGDEPEGRRSHGKGASRAYWLGRGYAAVSPSACDTWSAPPSRVS
ncbi:neutral zinc metallopeptidase [Nonomuraea dietziae]|uniref:Metalloprotease-like protein n=1 Tax=Nonomuraea dietziae TaxID=65515 RepID=A0A7W5Y6Z4_9ACTN|nr:neutral zinc metallopeptidase [Nonomuraea dietziae]MBB3726708.1 hypothetical protein [Nonomuraea dietziae]